MALTPLTFDILLALTDGSRHGYGIIKDIEDRSGVGSAPSTGALYLALRRMGSEGLIEDDEGARAKGVDSRRRYYRLTATGREEASNESRRLATLVTAARKKNLLGGSA